MVKMPPQQLAKLDAWIADQSEPISRPEAVRRLVDYALANIDNPVWTEEDFARARPASEVVGPEAAKALVRKSD